MGWMPTFCESMDRRYQICGFSCWSRPILNCNLASHLTMLHHGPASIPGAIPLSMVYSLSPLSLLSFLYKVIQSKQVPPHHVSRKGRHSGREPARLVNESVS